MPLLTAQTPNSPDWWLLRLGRRLQADLPRLNDLDAYWRGDHPLPFGNRKMREAYRQYQRQSRTNFCKLVTESVVERLKVLGFRAGGTGTDTVDKVAWGWWQANNLDARAGLVHRAAGAMSRAYVIVAPDKDDPTQPRVTGEDPRQVITESDPADQRKVLAAMKTWWDDIESCQRAVVYLPTALHYYRTESQSQQDAQPTAKAWAPSEWSLDLATYPDGSAANSLDQVPVVPFLNAPDLYGNTLGEFEDVLPIQDRINTQILNRLVIAAMQAYRQRYGTGISAVDEHGNPQDNFDPGADLMWLVDDPDAKFGEFQPSDLSGVLKAVEADVQHLAAITRTPPSYMLGSLVNASGDALAAAEVGLVSKVFERSTEYGESWELVYRLAGKVMGRDIPADCEVIWKDPQFRTLTEMAAAQVQMATAGIPWRTRMEMMNFSPAAIDRMQIERTQEAMLNAAILPAIPRESIDGGPLRLNGANPTPGTPAAAKALPGPQGGAAVPASAAARSANGPTP